MEPLTVTTASTTSWLVCNFKFLVLNQTYATFLAYQQQQQMNALHYSMMFQQAQQAQIGTLQSQVQLPQQIVNVPSNNLTFTSAGPVFSSRSFTPSTSKAIYSVAPQPTTVHTPITEVHSYSEQHNPLCDNSLNRTSSSSSQVHIAMYYDGLTVL